MKQSSDYIGLLAEEFKYYFGSKTEEEGEKIRELFALIIELDEVVPFLVGLQTMNSIKDEQLKEKLIKTRNKEFKTQPHKTNENLNLPD